MAKPIVYKTTHRILFSDLDPYDHVSTANYATYFVDHRMAGLSDNLGWDVAALRTLSFMMFVRKMEIDFLRPAQGGQEIVITSFVRDFQGADAIIELNMVDAKGKTLARGVMTCAHVERQTQRASDWPADVVALFFEKASG
jgi:acyl-CoA thioester hydrolase